MTRWGRQERSDGRRHENGHRRHPELEELPELPREFESVFLQAAQRIKELANNIKGITRHIDVVIIGLIYV